MKIKENILDLASDFKKCRKLLVAIGDENRIHMIIEMMQMNKCDGVRVGEITKLTNLSRPAVSHHLRILKEAGVISIRKEGTKNYYYFDHQLESMKFLIQTLENAVKLVNNIN